MKQTLRLIPALLVLTAIAFMVGLKLRTNKVITQTKDLLVIKEDSFTFYKDLYSTEHIKRLQVDADKQLIAIAFGNYVDSIKKREGLKDKQMQGFTSISTESNGNIKAKIDTVYIDGKKSLSFSYSDKWLMLNGTLTDKANINYSFSDSIILTNYWKRSWFLGAKRYYIDGYSLNPNVHFSGIQDIKITPNKKHWSIGPCLNYGFNGLRWEPTLGVSVQY